MKSIDALIKKLEEAREELSKNENCSPAAPQNTAKPNYGKVTVMDNTPKPADSANPYGKVIIKEEDGDINKTDDISKMPLSHLKQKTEEVQQKAKERHGDTLKLDGAHHKNWSRGDHEYFLTNYAKQHGVSLKHEPSKPAEPAKPKTILRPKLNKSEELEKDAANPALAPKEVKVKQLQAQIDAGTYKPNPSKIADKMLKEELTCSENGQWKIMEKSKNPYTVEHHDSYNHDNGTIHQYNIHHNGQHVASGYIHQPARGRKAEAPVISPESDEHSHHNNAQAMSALEQHVGKDPR